MCSANCSTCSTPGTCSGCSPGFTLTGGSCVPICSSNCLTCSKVIPTPSDSRKSWIWLYITGPIVGVAIVGLVIYIIIAKVKASAIKSDAAKSKTSSGATEKSAIGSENDRLKPENKELKIKVEAL